jgi:hypothetical protein
MEFYPTLPGLASCLRIAAAARRSYHDETLDPGDLPVIKVVPGHVVLVTSGPFWLPDARLLQYRGPVGRQQQYKKPRDSHGSRP